MHSTRTPPKPTIPGESIGLLLPKSSKASNEAGFNNDSIWVEGLRIISCGNIVDDLVKRWIKYFSGKYSNILHLVGSVKA